MTTTPVPMSQQNANFPNQSQPMTVTLNQSPVAQPGTVQNFQMQPQSPNQQAFQAQPQSPNQQAFQAQPQMQIQQGFQQQPMQQAYGMQYQQAPMQGYGMQYQQQAQMQDAPTCCCCIPMKIGLIIIAIVGISVGLAQISSIGYIFTTELADNFWFSGPGVLLGILNVAYIIACGLLIAGAFTRKKPFFGPYIFAAIIIAIIEILFACALAIFLAMFNPKVGRMGYRGNDHDQLIFNSGVFVLVIFLFWIPFLIYSFVVVVIALKRRNRL